ncbi:ABC transporter substrate-binding protein [Halopseudomonas phragmitis]|uniref:ABC transporter substrate-binding protein n=1 Tax=Halopseudomonas phragmitis TaxID=1931241 RepID=A0A1V0B7Z4_9GAMM|nr:ABC transporter substrate-binding protein [Halopseudomonas phragmitis]AQZ96056.1 ABC transporter substrate-binding protein [Halopseudomonas phragmitis]
MPLFALRFLLLFALLLSTITQASPRLASLDWTLGETLVALGAPPLAMAQVDDYHAWVGEPQMPDNVIDLGLRTQPNQELLAALAPERILISQMFTNLTPRLSRIAPVELVQLYTPGTDTWTQMLELTREVGRLAGRDQAAEQLIASTRARIDSLAGQLSRPQRPLLIIQFMDARHVRVFGPNGLYQVVLDQLGLDNAWTGGTNAWGFALVSIDALVGLDAQLVVVEPKPAGVERELASSALWQHLPGVADNQVITLPPVWSFGALPSCQRFAELLSAALEQAHD